MSAVLPDISIDQFMYELPPDRIASFPTDERDGSKLLVFKSGEISDDWFPEIIRHLPRQSLLVFNNTRVIHARLRFKRATGAVIEILCLEPANHLSPEQCFRSHEPVTWNCIVGNLRKWKDPELRMEIKIGDEPVVLTAVRKELINDGVVVEFSWNRPDIPFAAILDEAGELPIPPYLNRETTDVDTQRYNTVYAKHEGSVAAPTAGLHFTPVILEQLKANGMAMGNITLHVGAGTFKPVKPGPLALHEMHEERMMISRDFLEMLLQQLDAGLPVIPVGTTAVRTLESIYWLGWQVLKQPDFKCELFVGQWLPYQSGQVSLTAKEAVQALLDWLEQQQRTGFHAYTRIMIVPGYRFRIINGLITNFHQPGSSLLLLIAALIGNDWKKVYDHALRQQYRFLSYGDSSLLLPQEINS